ncbi:ParB/RepB/Spo0J family partition protein [Streptomyces sp. NPDC020196]|uniref:ParB/RepB/Spo0J family partition protein n=1 Tax=Streptomyces sp. NPDC020196 TaxID=3156656 RepID=UPI0033DEF5B3
MSKAEQFAQSSAFNRAGGARSARRERFDAATGHRPEPTELRVSLISQNPDNPRDHLRDLDYMTQTVVEVGVVNAITVANISAYLQERPDRAPALDPDTTYIVIDGHRRLEAARRAGLDTIKVTVDDGLVSTDETLLEAAFVANYHRDNMTELEEAMALEKLVKFYGTQAKASKRLGMAQSTISSKLSYLKLSPDLQADLAEGRRTGEQLRNLGKLAPEKQREEADQRAAVIRERARRTAQVAQTEPPPARPDVAPGAQEEPRSSAVEEHDGRSHQQALEPAPAVPEPRTVAERPAPQPPVTAEESAVGQPVSKVPWHDGEAVAELAISKMTTGELDRLRKALEASAPAER